MHVTSSAPQKRLVALWSRDVDPSRLAGRTQMIEAIRREMSVNYSAEHLRIHNLMEKRSFRSIAGAIISALQTSLSGRLPSLQCLLFCDRDNHEDILKRLRENPPQTLYCDGVRCFYLLKRLGSLRSTMKIVVDFDDLMSRRMQSLSTTNTPLSLGYLHDKMPRRLRSALALGFMSKTIASYEQRALAGVEDQIGQWADVVVLISQVEGDALQSLYKKLGHKAKVHVIPPQVEVVGPPHTYEDFSKFIFIGTDALPQNKLSIQLIQELWQSVQPEAEIHIFGHMVSHWPTVRGVIFKGYAPHLREIYANNVVLFAPGELRGGLKTKVAEAFSHGCAVVGNDITFEGMHLPDNPLRVETREQMTAIIKHPRSYLQQMKASAVSGQQYVRTFISRETFQRNWDEALN